MFLTSCSCKDLLTFIGQGVKHPFSSVSALARTSSVVQNHSNGPRRNGHLGSKEASTSLYCPLIFPSTYQAFLSAPQESISECIYLEAQCFQPVQKYYKPNISMASLQGDCNSDWGRNNWLHGYSSWAVSVTTEMAEAVLSLWVHFPLELSCGMAFAGTPNLLLHKVSWHSLTYSLMYFDLILADLLLKKRRNSCMSLSASSTLMAVPSSRKTIVSKTSTEAFTSYVNNPQLRKSSQARCSGRECGFFPFNP